MQYFLIKSEPSVYSWDTFLQEKQTFWSGVRSHQAKNNLKLMKKDDLLLFYHSNEGKEIVGVAKVLTEAYKDDTAGETDKIEWVGVDVVPVETLKSVILFTVAPSASVGVDVVPVETLKKPITLAFIKADEILKEMLLVKQSRLSVTAVTKQEFERIIELANM